ncbi:hypothetical protein PHOBOS_42 [Erwinia phage vB_EamM_Phobos]|uniref:hypothetical protein n=1 Tax=Erwinia phage vB_EamM_Phobos TaxID=1883377 RepID=UPI00081CF64B|nr:hypothetical protein BIZ79_gp042 [Erwinia phage vB_EamM_Phobos]ANZ50232.1 hypothetical protein PHOBOS_42 [Erwinia phage vB_EamM_Phobos]
MINTLKLDTTSLFKRRDHRAVTYQEAYDELMASYDQSVGLETGRYHVAMSFQEDPLANSLYQIWVETFIREDVYKYMGMNFQQFLQQPRWLIDMQLKAIKRRHQDETALANEIKNTLPPDK